jgi:uncharacterized LabA/DUF88 family protein
MADQPATPKNYAFIDSQNLNLGVQRMGWKLDWRKFRQYLNSEFNVTTAYMFIGYMSENEAMYEYMHELGYLVVLKPTIDVKAVAQPQSTTTDTVDATHPKDTKENEEPKSTVKGNVDAELVLYAMKEWGRYDQAVIVSGDGDFFSLAEYLDEHGKLAQILTPNWQYSTLLKIFEPKLTRLDQLRRKLAYNDHRNKNSLHSRKPAN